MGAIPIGGLETAFQERSLSLLVAWVGSTRRPGIWLPFSGLPKQATYHLVCFLLVVWVQNWLAHLALVSVISHRIKRPTHR